MTSDHRTQHDNISRMNEAPEAGTGMDIVIVSTTSPADEGYWQHRLEATRGQITNRDARIIAVHEDWPGGAGNGLGTLYALHLARQKGQLLYGIDLLDELRRGASVAIYHTAGKGTRLAPLPAVEGNNKPAVKLPGLLRISGSLQPVTVLESVIKQTGIYAPCRQGRLSVFWGDQVFVPSVSCHYRARHHIDIIGQLGPMPDRQSWEARGMSGYGLLAVDANGDACQVEKVSYDQLQSLIKRQALSVDGGIGVSIGSFSLSTPCALALMQEFADELDAKDSKLDTDPHFWMPMTLDRQTYQDMRAGKEDPAFDLHAHYDRMQAFAKRLTKNAPALRLFTVVDVGDQSYWWDYGQLHLYHQNILLMCAPTPEGQAVRHFFGADSRHRDSDLHQAVQVDDTSCILGSHLSAGRVVNSVIVDSTLPDVDLHDCVLIGVHAPAVTARGALLYTIHTDTPLELQPQDVRVHVPLNAQTVPMHTRLSRNGRDDWHTRLPGNPYTYDDLHQAVKNRLQTKDTP